MKKISLMITVLLIVLLAAGCVPTERTDLGIAPDFSGTGNAEIDMIQLHNDTIAAFDDPEPYAFVSFVEVDGNNTEKMVTVTIASMEDEEYARIFAAALLKKIASAAAVQNTGYTEPTSSDFGSFWNTYSARFLFYRTEDIEVEDAVPFYEYSLPAGEKSDLDPNTEAYEAEYHRQVELLKRNDGVQ